MKIALVQMEVRGGEPKINLAQALRRLEEAANHQAEIVVLPEAMNLGWSDPSANSLSEKIPGGYTFEALKKSAERHKIFVCAGIVEKRNEKILNSAVLINPEGELVIRYSKIHIVEPGSQYYEKGQELFVADTILGKLGVMICADAFIEGQVIARTLVSMGAEIILSPNSWAVNADHDQQKDPYGGLWLHHYGAVAKDFDVWIVGVSNVGKITGGPWKGFNCIGCSMVIAPGGEPIFRGDYGIDRDEIYYVEVSSK